MVRASTGSAVQARRLEPSDLSSTRFNEVSPRIVDIFGRVQIAVMVCSALWAVPFSGIERESIQNVSAAVAAFAAGKEAVHKPQLPSVSLAFVVEHLSELPEAGVGKGFGQGLAFNHPPDVQILDADSVVSADQIGRHLVEVIFSGVADMFLYSGNADALPVPHAAIFDTSGENPLGLGKVSLVFARMLRVGDSLSVAGSSKPVNSKIDSRRLTGGFEFGKLFVQDQRDEVTSARSLGNGDGRGFRQKFAGPVHIEPT